MNKVEAAIAAADYSMTGFDRDARGLFAIEYLLFGQSATETVATFESNSNRGSYLTAAAQNVRERIATAAEAFGSQRESFISNDGSSAGSSISELYNSFVKSFEALKNFKVALPMGKRPGQTDIEPQLVQAYYSGYSLPLIKEHYEAVKSTWRGAETGFDEYLQTVPGGPELVTATEVQFAEVDAALAALDASQSFSQQLQTPEAEQLQVALQQLTRFLKSDMSSVLGISITYASGDGD